MNIGDLMAQAMAEARTEQDRQPSDLSVEAKVTLTREVYDEYLRPTLNDECEGSSTAHANMEVQVGDFVVQKDYLGILGVPSAKAPGILHEVFAPVRGHTIGEDNGFYTMELYDCTVAVLHEGGSGASLVIVPANTRRLKKYEQAE